MTMERGLRGEAMFKQITERKEVNV